MQAGRLLTGVVLAGALIGFKFYNKSTTLADTRDHLIEVCAGDSECTLAVDAHFDGCFDDSYSMGSRRRGATLDASALVECINIRSGVPHFEMSP